MQHLGEMRWGQSIDTGWSDGDLEIFADPWTHIGVRTVQEEHGGGNRLIRVRFDLSPSRFARLALSVIVCAVVWAAVLQPLAGLLLAGGMGVIGGVLWQRGRKLRSILTAIFHAEASRLGLVLCNGQKPVAETVPAPVATQANDDGTE